jgi:hypothetical protein
MTQVAQLTCRASTMSRRMNGDASGALPTRRRKPSKPERHSSRAEIELQCGKPHRHRCGKSAPKMTMSQCGKPHHYGGGNPHHYLYLGGMGGTTSPPNIIERPRAALTRNDRKPVFDIDLVPHCGPNVSPRRSPAIITCLAAVSPIMV